MKKILAALTAAVLGLGVGAGAVTLPAFATVAPPYDEASTLTAPTGNFPSTWQTLPGEICVNYDDPGSPFTFGAPEEGREYSKLILKSGNVGTAPGSVAHENYVWYAPNVIPGAEYYHPEKDSISHAILCTIPVVVGVTITVEPSVIDPTCDEDGSLVVPVIAHVTWTGGADGDGPGSYELTAVADSGYSISGQSVFNREVLGQLDGEECDSDQPVIITVEPSDLDPTCDEDGSLVVPVIAHVTWTGGADGDGPGSYELTAVADPGYYISGQFVFNVEVLGQLEGRACSKLAAVEGDPTPTDAACAEDEESSSTDGFYTIHEAEGVGYLVFVDGLFEDTIISTPAYGAIQFDVTSYPSLVEIYAFALPGYYLDEEATTYWSHNFLFDEELCNLQDFALVTPVVDQDPPSCTLSGRFFLGGDGVEWLTSPGGLPVSAGWHDVPSATTLAFQAVPAEGNGFDFETQTVFEFEFLAAPLECLDTLALTGNEGVPLFLGGAAALLLLGAASIFFARRRTV